MASIKSKGGFWAHLTSDHNNFYALLVTTPISTLLLYSSLNNVVFSGKTFTFIVHNRPVVQSGVQLIANLLSICQMLMLCRLINYAVRIHLLRKNMTMDSLRACIDAMIPRINWDLPMRYLVPLALFAAVSILLSALWAAAITPVEVWKAVDGHVIIPSWADVSLIREYPSEVGKEGMTMQNLKGRFSYSIGIQLLGSLLVGASSATTIDGSQRVHAKMDRSKFNYLGRSYGVGSSVGLVDENIRGQRLSIGYSYQELGYKASVKCIYNTTSDFGLDSTKEKWIYSAVGTLPDSDDGREYSSYVGYNTNHIVAIGVAHFAEPTAAELPPRRFLAFSTGSSYGFLDKVQCAVDFAPARFDIAVNLTDRSIAVKPTNDANAADINPSRRLKGTVLRQFELIANDETNIYVSTVGTALNASITDLRTFIASSDNSEKLSEADTVLRGVENSITVMTDDILGAYAAAQLMVGNITQATNATIRLSAIAIGEQRFCIAAFVVNVVVVLVVLFEAVRTRAWRDVPDFNVADIRHIIIAALEGGTRFGGGGGDTGYTSQLGSGKVPFRYTVIGDQRFGAGADAGSKNLVFGVDNDVELVVRGSKSRLGSTDNLI